MYLVASVRPSVRQMLSRLKSHFQSEVLNFLNKPRFRGWLLDYEEYDDQIRRAVFSKRMCFLLIISPFRHVCY